jgi:hypothetical protein
VKKALLSEETRGTGWQGGLSDGYLTVDEVAEQVKRPGDVQGHSHELP